MRRHSRESFADRMEKFNQPLQLETGTYWYVWGKLDNGQHIALGPFYSEQEAWDLGYSKFPDEFQVVSLRTRSLEIATQMLKGRYLKKGATLEQATKRVRHRGRDIGMP